MRVHECSFVDLKYVGRDGAFTEPTGPGLARTGAERTETENITDEVKVFDNGGRFNHM